jgi:carboxypeptidase C (cathepsin A)
MTPIRIALATTLALLCVAASTRAQETGRRDGAPPEGGRREAQAQPSAAPHRALLPADSTTDHEITVGGRKLAYTATAGTLALTANGEQTAEVFYLSFVLSTAGDPQRRPVTYLFNGGPGAASAYLDIGAIGPRALAVGGDGTLPATGSKVTDNPDTWLPFTDLVFIDPVGTGWSRATDPDKAAKEFWSVGSDIDAVAEIIRLHLTKTDRLGSPIYIVGESYGGFRAARLAHDLVIDKGIAPKGITMISPVIDFDLMDSGPLGVLSWALRLPSYAAASMGPKALEPGALDEVEHFALNDYLVAIAAGPKDGPASDAIYARIATLTGLDEATVAQWRGRISLDAYVSEVHRGDGRIVSRYDATVSGTDPNPINRRGHDDPILEGTVAPFTSAFVAYSRDELGFKTDQAFELLNREVSRRWDWDGERGLSGSPGSSDQLRRTLALEPQLKVMIAHGVDDLETPYMMSRYVRDHMPASLGDRIALKLYEGGHMLYLHAPSRHRLHDDAAAFYGAAEN